jgi:hypothetical protein
MSLVFSIQIKVAGVLTDADSTPVLSDPTDTYGIRRTDTAVTVVANNTAMTHDGTGLYSYTLSSPVAGVTYQGYAQVVVNGNTYYVEKNLTADINGGMTLTTARAMVRQFARNAGDSSMYSDTDVDRAIRFVCQRFVRFTRCVKATSTITLTASSSAASFAAEENFRPERLLRVWFTLAGVVKGTCTVVDHGEILEMLEASPSTEGVPDHIGFSSWSAAAVYPLPDEAYVLNALWAVPFTTFTPGTGTPDDITLNIPSDLLEEILIYGPPAVLQHNEPEHLYASASWQKYLEIEASMRSAGSFGARAAFRVKED